MPKTPRTYFQLVCGAAFSLALTGLAQAAPIFVAGPSPAAPFAGTTIDFEGFAEGTLISNQYAAQGVTFTQDDGGTPQADNQPFLFGYVQNSGVGVLTGTTNGGAPFPTVAGLVAEFTSPVARAAAFFSDFAPLGDYTITAYDTGGGVLESFQLLAGQLPTCSVPGCGVYVGFDFPGAVIGSVQFGPSAASGDAFAIDDLVFAGATVPEPSSLLLFGIALAGLVAGRRRQGTAHKG